MGSDPSHQHIRQPFASHPSVVVGWRSLILSCANPTIVVQLLHAPTSCGMHNKIALREAETCSPHPHPRSPTHLGHAGQGWLLGQGLAGCRRTGRSKAGRGRLSSVLACAGCRGQRKRKSVGRDTGGSLGVSKEQFVCGNFPLSSAFCLPLKPLPYQAANGQRGGSRLL